MWSWMNSKMNDRIKELAEQAGLMYPQFGPTVDTKHQRKKRETIEKFAELIVRESIEILEHRYKWDGDVTEGKETKMCIAKIKQHFGVE